MSDPIVKRLGTPMRLEYVASVGRHYERYLRELEQGRFVGGRCPTSRKVYVPPRGASPVSGQPTDEIVPLADTGVLTTFCIIRIPFEAQKLEPPYVFGAILLDGADMPIHHLVSGAPVDAIRMGLRVRAKWKPREQWVPSLENVAYFEPTGEPDAHFESFAEHL